MPTPSLSHLIITRFNIPVAYQCSVNPAVWQVDARTDEAYLSGRFDLFERFTAPSVGAQTCKDFRWVVLFSDATPEPFRQRLAKIQETVPQLEPHFLTDKQSYGFQAYLSGLVADLPDGLVLTTRMDNDDAIVRRFVENVQSYARATDGDDYVLTFPHGLQYNLKLRTASRLTIPSNHFLTLAQRRQASDNTTVIDFPHTEIPSCYRTVKLGDAVDPMWVEIIHGTNYVNPDRLSIRNIVWRGDAFKGFGCDFPWSAGNGVRTLLESLRWSRLGPQLKAEVERRTHKR